MDLVTRHLTPGGRPLPSPHRSRAFVMAALLAFATLATGVEVHPHREVLGSGLPHGLEGETISLGASHPASAPHLEAAGAQRTFRCPVCLLHLQSAGEASGEAVAGAATSSGGRLAAAAPDLPRGAFRLPGGSRAPPASR